MEAGTVENADLAPGRTGVRPDGPDPRQFGRWVRAAAWSAALGLALTCGGFFGFVASLDRLEPQGLPKGDAIVALTGGTDRIPDAVGWLAQGHGERLLISGVNTQISVDQLVQKAPRLRSWLTCCVDLDHQARNTVGNALETRRWAQGRGYRSLVIVTSSYHMPRALLELRRHMPETEFIAAPVVTERLHGLQYWRDLPLLKVLGQEYAKFVVAYARARLTTPSRSDDITADTHRRRA
jgi:uncharacterized SAM-binding protein YcdF (DUF218 family)